MDIVPGPLSLRGARDENRSKPPGLSFYANTLRKHLLHRSGGALLHVGEYVRVGVEGNGYGRMSEHLGDDLRVHVTGE
jgi:hypothetical protein